MQSAEKISITMTPEMMRLIRESVEAGDYASRVKRCATPCGSGSVSEKSIASAC